MNISVVRTNPTKETLQIIYDTCNKIFKDNEACFYTKEETKLLKQDKNNTFLWSLNGFIFLFVLLLPSITS